MSRTAKEILTVLFSHTVHVLVTCCPPEPIGNCYSGSTFLTTSYTGGITVRRCSNTINKEWCAVSYYASGNTANFGCANDFAVPFGSMTCGDGPGFINTQGCSMGNTPSGPCYFCCCRGGSCNHPAVFAREAARLPVFPQGLQQLFISGATSLSSSLITAIIVPLTVLRWL